MALLSKVVVGPATKNPVAKEEELPLKIVIRLTPLMALNQQELFTDEEKQSMMEQYFGGKMVAEERYRLSPQHPNIRYCLRSCA